MLIINDVHISVQRQGGTTPLSQSSLRGYQFAALRRLLETDEQHLVCAGDLFDSFEVPSRDLIETYEVFSNWLSQNRRLTLIAGNHDNSSRADKVSSFTLLGRVLSDQYGQAVRVIDINQSGFVEPRVHAVAHHANQALFNEALDAALTKADQFDFLILHCNLNNTFAQQSDHSLDISADRARDFKEAGVHVLLAHEHNPRIVGNVTVLGCQTPTSVLDCLDSPEKFAHTLNDGELKKIRTWDRNGEHGYHEVDWRILHIDPIMNGFVRVTGKADADEASEVVNQIARFRQKSNAFVIGNAVQVAGLIEVEELPKSFEAARRFDVMEYISAHLSGEEMEVVNKLLEGA